MNQEIRHAHLDFELGRLGYIQFGEGKNLILAFPGYGRSAIDFAVMKDQLPLDHSFLAIDYFGNGDSSLHDSDIIIPVDQIHSLIHSIPEVRAADSITYLGYSLGGRVVMTLFNHSQAKIDRIILIAADGLKKNLVHYFLSGTSGGRALFAFTAERPALVRAIVRTVIGLRFVNEKLGRFIMSNTTSSDSLNKVRLTWKNFGRFWPDLKMFKKLLAETNTPVRIVMGKHDRIILPSFANSLRKAKGLSTELIIADGGHDLIRSGYPFSDWLK